jgi:hypothetical protein
MSAIRKQILVNGNTHYVEINSSLELEEVEITGSDPISGKTVHISLSSLLKFPKQPEPSPITPQPFYGFEQALPSSPAQSPPPAMDMFSEPVQAPSPYALQAQPLQALPSQAPAPLSGVEPAKGLEAIKKENIQGQSEDVDSALKGMYGY